MRLRKFKEESVISYIQNSFRNFDLVAFIGGGFLKGTCELASLEFRYSSMSHDQGPEEKDGRA